MKLHINIAEDAELRGFIKEQIRNAVKAITREEILQMVASELTGKLKGYSTPILGNLLQEEVKRHVKSILEGTSWTKGAIESIVREEVKIRLTEHLKKTV